MAKQTMIPQQVLDEIARGEIRPLYVLMERNPITST
jgi:hypothetical protein